MNHTFISRHLLRLWIFLLLSIPGLSRAAVTSSNAPPRIAILAADTNEMSRTVADLLLAELAQQPNVEFVERANIDRVLTEQTMSLAGLTESFQRVRAGRLLRADALLLASTDTNQHKTVIRLVETRQGFLARRWSYNYSNTRKEEMASAIAHDWPIASDKLGLNPTHYQLACIVYLYNEASGMDLQWLTDVMESELLRDSRILLLERRELGQLLTEEELTGQTNNLLRSSLLIEGGMTLRPDTAYIQTNTPVVFTVLMQNQARRMRGSANGVLGEEEAMVRNAVRSALAGLPALSNAIPNSGEFTAFLGLAGNKVLWAAETAFALDKTSYDARYHLVDQYAGSGDPAKIARAVQIAAGNDSLMSLAAFCVENTDPYWPSAGENGLSYCFHNVRAALGPVQGILRDWYERKYHINEDYPRKELNVKHARAFICDYRLYVRYFRKLYERVQSATNMSPDQKLFNQTQILYDSVWWPRTGYERLLKHPEAVIRYCARKHLLRWEQNDTNKTVLAQAQARDICIILRNPFLRSHLSLTELQYQIRDCMEYAPTEAPALSAAILHMFSELLQKGDLSTLSMLSPASWLEFTNPADSIPLMDHIVARVSNDPKAMAQFRTKFAIQKLREQLIDWKLCYGGSETRSQDTQHVLLSPQHPRWPEIIADILRKLPAPENKLGLLPVPLHTLVDGSELWISFGFGLQRRIEYIDGAFSSHSGAFPRFNAFMVRMDLKTGAILGWQAISRLEGSSSWRGRDEDFDVIAVHEACPWRDGLLLPISMIGLVYVPRQGPVDLVPHKNKFLNNSDSLLACVGDKIYFLSNPILSSMDPSDATVRIELNASRFSSNTAHTVREFTGITSDRRRFLYLSALDNAAKPCVWRLDTRSNQWSYLLAESFLAAGISSDQLTHVMNFAPDILEKPPLSWKTNTLFQQRIAPLTTNRALHAVYDGGGILFPKRGPSKAWRVLWDPFPDTTASVIQAWAPQAQSPRFTIPFIDKLTARTKTPVSKIEDDIPKIQAWGGDPLNRALLHAAARGDLVAMRKALDGGADINCVDYQNRSPLVVAICFRQVKAALFLMRNNAKAASAKRYVENTDWEGVILEDLYFRMLGPIPPEWANVPDLPTVPGISDNDLQNRPAPGTLEGI